MANSRNSAPGDGRGRSPHARFAADVPSPRPPFRRAGGNSGKCGGNTAGNETGGVTRRSRKAPLSPVPAAVAAALAEFVTRGARVVVALSGGIDSMVLLDALASFAERHPFTLSAVHINHGLSPNADSWARFCAEQCAGRGVPLAVDRLELRRKPGASLEALARAARYERLRAAEADIVALAHHADDQAETVLLQLLRGAGPRGLSAMPRFCAGKPALLRPLLALTRSALAAYAAARALAWIEDESNAQTRHKRNLIRHEIAPLLAAHFPGYPATLLRAAAHQAEASTLLDDLAALDAAAAVDAQGIDRVQLAALSPARARNLLRWFLRNEGLKPPSKARLADMLRQFTDGAPASRVRVVHDGADIGCHRGRVIVHAPPAAAFTRTWDGEAEVRLPGGTLMFERTRGGGMAAAKLAQGTVTLRSRSGGERMQLAANRPRRALKKLMQEARLPPWQRDALPLVWCGDELAAVPGIGVASAFQAAPGEVGWTVDWLPETPAPGRIRPTSD
jgi:tRNA(Ile)-lysidine synthase